MPEPPDTSRIAFFQKNLLAWSAENKRPLPWKGESDPYKIWLSEIILQQTRVEQGLPYYEKFLAQYPDVHALAEASEDEVFKLWEGLGYYSRARNLHATAQQISQQWDGSFPDTYAQLRTLKGVGDYTAAAIASFAFGLPHAVLDGNVYRVLARFWGIETPVDTPAAKKEFSQLAQSLLDVSRPAAYNQAIMDFGAVCCTSQNPRCQDCPMSANCTAYQTNSVKTLPLKSKNMLRKKRVFHYLVVNFEGDVLVRKRRERDIWQGLWEFPTTESAVSDLPFADKIVSVSSTYRQLLTHQEVYAVFYEIQLSGPISADFFQQETFAGCERMARKDVKKKVAFPQIIARYLRSNVLTLGLYF